MDYEWSDERLRIISIDPGTNSAGFAIIELDLKDLSIHVPSVYTLHARKVIKDYKELAELSSEKDAKLMGYYDHLHELIKSTEPYMVASEAPYMGRFAAAYGALKEQLLAFRKALWTYNKHLPFVMIEPSPVKKHMQVNGRSGDKDLMLAALLTRTDLLYGSGIDPASLDEHSVDAICVGLYFIDTIVKDLTIK